MKEQKLCELVKNDPIYMNMLVKCKELESKFIQLREHLSVEEQELLDEYISLCEELEHRRTTLALLL